MTETLEERMVDRVTEILAMLPEDPYDKAEFLQEEGLNECRSNTSNCPLASWIAVNLDPKKEPWEIDVNYSGIQVYQPGDCEEYVVISCTGDEKLFMSLFDRGRVGMNLRQGSMPKP